MRRHILILIPLLVFLLPNISPGQSPMSASALYDSIVNPDLRKEAATLSDVVIIRGGQELSFSSGTLRFMEPVHGKIYAAAFRGKGSFVWAIPTRAEQESFERETGLTLTDGKYIFSFDRAVLWFGSALVQDMGNLTFTSTGIDNKERATVERSTRYVSDKYNQEIPFRLIQELTSSAQSQYLFAHFLLPDGKEFFFTFDPSREEEVTLAQPPYRSITGAVFWLSTINSFHEFAEYASANEYDLLAEQQDGYKCAGLKAEINIRRSGELFGTSRVALQRAGNPPASALFWLDHTLKLDSVIDGSGHPLSFFRKEDASLGFVVLPSGDSTQSLTFWYHGKFLEPYHGSGDKHAFGSDYWLASSSEWYPVFFSRSRFDFDVTYHVPAAVQLLSAGRKVSDEVHGDIRDAHYTSIEPTYLFSFELGEFKEIQYRLSDTEMTVHLYHGGTYLPLTAENLANSMRLYKWLFGDCGWTELRAAYHARSNEGEAFQEFVKLPYVEDMIEHVALASAHEAAHAWWGYGVDVMTYHDRWIGEAFAQYSALLYAPFVLKDDKPLLEKLRKIREELVGLRKYALGSGPKLSSIWLGPRASGPETPYDYVFATYQKGAWVLHMIRMMMVDLKTMNEDPFRSMLREFYTTYRGKWTSTLDLKKMVEKYFREDMTWFFDQWVTGNDIPTLGVHHTIQKSPEGKYLLSMKIEQSDVEKPFRIYLPIQITYADGSVARTRLLVDKSKNDYSYTLDKEPRTVDYNTMESVLCKVEQ